MWRVGVRTRNKKWGATEQRKSVSVFVALLFFFFRVFTAAAAYFCDFLYTFFWTPHSHTLHLPTDRVMNAKSKKSALFLVKQNFIPFFMSYFSLFLLITLSLFASLFFCLIECMSLSHSLCRFSVCVLCVCLRSVSAAPHQSPIQFLSPLSHRSTTAPPPIHHRHHRHFTLYLSFFLVCLSVISGQISPHHHHHHHHISKCFGLLYR